MSDHKRDLLNELISSLRSEPQRWRWGNGGEQSYIVHETGVDLWVYMHSAHVWHPNIKFGFIGRLRLRSAFRQWRRVRGRAEAATIENYDVLKVLAKLRSSPSPHQGRG